MSARPCLARLPVKPQESDLPRKIIVTQHASLDGALEDSVGMEGAGYPPGLIGTVGSLFGRCIAASDGVDWTLDWMIAEQQ
ncbi:MAG TPA: hypothetical protein VGL55_13365 [Steroidobacteraceae bacterium]